MLGALRSENSGGKSVLEAALGGSIDAIKGSAEASSSEPGEADDTVKKLDLKSMISQSAGLNAVTAFAMAGKAYRWRQHERVLKSLDDWWTMMEQELVASGKMEEGLDVDDYLKIFKLVYKALVQHYDDEEATQAVLADWRIDARGEDRLPASKLRDAVFELADVWTKGDSPDECALFLDDLRLQLVAGDGSLRSVDAVDTGCGAALESAVNEPEDDEDSFIKPTLPNEPDVLSQAKDYLASSEPATPRASKEPPVPAAVPVVGFAPAPAAPATPPHEGRRMRRGSVAVRRGSVMGGIRRESVSGDALRRRGSVRPTGRKTKWKGTRRRPPVEAPAPAPEFGSPAPATSFTKPKPEVQRSVGFGGSFQKPVELSHEVKIAKSATMISKYVRAWRTRTVFVKLLTEARAERKKKDELAKAASLAPRSTCFTRPMSLVASSTAAKAPAAAIVYPPAAPIHDKPTVHLQRAARTDVRPPTADLHTCSHSSLAWAAGVDDPTPNSPHSPHGPRSLRSSYTGACTGASATAPVDESSAANGAPSAPPPSAPSNVLPPRGASRASAAHSCAFLASPPPWLTIPPRDRPRVDIGPGEHRSLLCHGGSPSAWNADECTRLAESRPPRTAAARIRSFEMDAKDRLTAAVATRGAAMRRSAPVERPPRTSPAQLERGESVAREVALSLQTPRPPPKPSTPLAALVATPSASFSPSCRRGASPSGQHLSLLPPIYDQPPSPPTSPEPPEEPPPPPPAPAAPAPAAQPPPFIVPLPTPPPPTAHALLGALAQGSLSARRLVNCSAAPRLHGRQVMGAQTARPHTGGGTLAALLRGSERVISIEAVWAARVADDAACMDRYADAIAKSHLQHPITITGVSTMTEIDQRRRAFHGHLSRQVLGVGGNRTPRTALSSGRHPPVRKLHVPQVLQICAPFTPHMSTMSMN